MMNEVQSSYNHIMKAIANHSLKYQLPELIQLSLSLFKSKIFTLEMVSLTKINNPLGFQISVNFFTRNNYWKFPQKWLVLKLVYFALINLQSSNQTVAIGCNWTPVSQAITWANHFKSSPLNPPMTTLSTITKVTNSRHWLYKIVDV